MRRTLLLVVLVTFLSMPGMTASSAAAVGEVTITADQPFGSDGTFTATGGPICTSGTTTESPVRITEGRRSAALTFHLDKSFVCDDGSGSFTVQISARVQPCDANDYGAWAITRGTGSYTDLRGAGSLIGSYYPTDSCDAEGVVDVFSGRLTVR
jgi:hypothetical protein